MSSDLAGIYADLGNREITLSDGTAVPALPVQEARERVLSDLLPIRLILPPGANGGPGVERVQVLTGGYSKVTWRIVDLLLFEAVGRAGGLSALWPKLIDYIAQYAVEFTGNKSLGNGLVTGFYPQAGVFNWPEGGLAYQGVLTTLLVEETICG